MSVNIYLDTIGTARKRWMEHVKGDTKAKKDVRKICK